jgi:hypothetical protein
LNKSEKVSNNQIKAMSPLGKNRPHKKKILKNGQVHFFRKGHQNGQLDPIGPQLVKKTMAREF